MEAIDSSTSLSRLIPGSHDTCMWDSHLRYLVARRRTLRHLGRTTRHHPGRNGSDEDAAVKLPPVAISVECHTMIFFVRVPVQQGMKSMLGLGFIEQELPDLEHEGISAKAHFPVR